MLWGLHRRIIAIILYYKNRIEIHKVKIQKVFFIEKKINTD